MELIRDAWLSDVLGRPCFGVKITGTSVLPSELKAPGVFAYSKVSTQNVDHALQLQALGFRVVDTSLQFEKAVNNSVSAVSSVRFANQGDQAAITDVAEHSFRFSRFHADPQIPKALADKSKREWALNFFKGGRGDAMVVGLSNGKAQGFLQLVYRQKVLFIDLIAVAPSAQGRGLAKSMIQFAERECGEFETIQVGTQAANTPSVRLYEGLGFRLIGSLFVLHYHS